MDSLHGDQSCDDSLPQRGSRALPPVVGRNKEPERFWPGLPSVFLNCCHRYTHTHTHDKTLSIFPPAFTRPPPGLDSLIVETMHSFLKCAYSQVQKNLGAFFRKCEIMLFADIFRTWPRGDEEPAAPDRSQGGDAAAREKCDASPVRSVGESASHAHDQHAPNHEHTGFPLLLLKKSINILLRVRNNHSLIIRICEKYGCKFFRKVEKMLFPDVCFFCNCEKKFIGFFSQMQK